MGIFDNDILRGTNYYVNANLVMYLLQCGLFFTSFTQPSTEFTIEMFDSLLFADSEDICLN